LLCDVSLTSLYHQKKKKSVNGEKKGKKADRVWKSRNASAESILGGAVRGRGEQKGVGSCKGAGHSRRAEKTDQQREEP